MKLYKVELFTNGMTQQEIRKYKNTLVNEEPHFQSEFRTLNHAKIAAGQIQKKHGLPCVTKEIETPDKT